MKLKIKKGDLVRVIAGNDRDKTVRRVLAVYPEKLKVLVEGVNVVKKHSRPSQTNPKGGIISKEMPIHYSNISLVDSQKKTTKVGIRFEESNGNRVAIRYAKTDKKDI